MIYLINIIYFINDLFIKSNLFNLCDIMAENNNERAMWGSSFGFMMAMIGSAVGLGNIWRFPNVLYSNGGGSFMIPYIISILVLGISFIFLEYSLGYRFKSSVSKILYSIKPKLEPIAWLICVIIFLILTYYICVVGWDTIYLVLSFFKGWGTNPDTFFSSSVLQSSSSISGIMQFVPAVLVSIIVMWAIVWFITQRNLNDGIAKVSKILIPLLMVMVVIIVAFSLTLPGASIGYTKMFTPDWSALANPNIWLAAFGQIVFSLSLGMAIAITYASYLPEGSKLTNSGLIVAASNSGFEVFNAIGVFSILGFMTLSTGIPFDKLVTEGTGLAFVVFPQVFNTMGTAAYIIGPLFFACILFAGLTSAIALVEPISASITDKFNIPRRRSATIVCLIGLIVSLIFATSAGSLILGVFDSFLNNFALLLTIVIECIIFGWVYNLDNLVETLNEYSTIKVGKLWKFLIKIAIPVILLFLWLSSVYDTIVTGDLVSHSIIVILAICLIGIPLILTKFKPRNPHFHEKIDDS